MAKRLTTEEFKKQLEKENPTIELLSEYNGNKNYITVRCKTDGNVWETKPNWLHAGHGCIKCYTKRSAEVRSLGKEEFIRRAIESHGDRYDYSKVEYKNEHTKVCIICPKHGEFWVKPHKHILGKQGCPKCANKHVTTVEFIEKARKVHGDKYDYSKVTYINNRTKIIIICPEHGEFEQTPDKHLQGRGCSKCKFSNIEREVEILLHKNNINYEYEKKFPEWLGKQSLDFYLPDYNVAIECQGEQHFSGWKRDENSFLEIYKRDNEKFNKCVEHNIDILYYYSKRFENNNLDLYKKTISLSNKKELLETINKFDKFTKWLND